LILYLVGLRMMNPPTALAGMMLASLHAPFAAVSFYMFTESVFFFFLLLSVLFLSRESYRSLIGAGALLTITALTRSVAVAALPIWLLFAAMKSTGRHRYIAPLIILVSFSCFAVPWAVRNKTKVQHPIIGSSFAGKDLFVGNNDTYRRSFSQPPARAWESLHAIQRFLIRIVGAGPSHVKNMFNFPVKIANEVERDRELRLRSFTFIIAYPRTFIRLVWDRLEAMTGLSGEPRLWDRVGILPVLFLPMLCVIPFGFIGNTGIFRFHIFLLLSAILLAVPPLITVGYPRYRLPSDWFFFLLAGSGIHYVMYTFSSVMGSHYKTAWRKIRPVFGR